MIVLRTFSKIHGLANLRLGYGIGPPELIRVLQKTREPFNVNGTRPGGRPAALTDRAHPGGNEARVTDEGRKKYLEEEFAAMKLTFVPSVANFVLVRVGDGKAIFEALLRKGVIVRALTGYNFPEWVRVSVGTMEQNRRHRECCAGVLAADLPLTAARHGQSGVWYAFCHQSHSTRPTRQPSKAAKRPASAPLAGIENRGASAALCTRRLNVMRFLRLQSVLPRSISSNADLESAGR